MKRLTQRSLDQDTHAPRVSVGMPVYNAARWLDRSIEAILEQTFEDLELVISDNASTDESFDIAQRYADKDNRVRLFRNPANLGVSKNYSRLVQYARGEYFKWASSNDLCDRTFIEKCVKILDARSDVSLCCPRTKLFVTDPETGDEYAAGLQTLDANPLARFRQVLEHVGLNNTINGLIRMSVLGETGLMRSHYASDVTLLAEIALRGKLVELPEYLFFRRFDEESATALQDPVRYRACHFPRPGLAMWFQTWRQCAGYVSAINCRGLTLPQRALGLAYVAKLWHWALPELYADVQEVVATIAARASRGRR